MKYDIYKFYVVVSEVTEIEKLEKFTTFHNKDHLITDLARKLGDKKCTIKDIYCVDLRNNCIEHLEMVIRRSKLELAVKEKDIVIKESKIDTNVVKRLDF